MTIDMKTLAEATARDAVKLGLVTRAPATFLKKLTVKKGRGERTCGGVDWRTGNPMVRFSADWRNGENHELEEYAAIASDPVIGSIQGREAATLAVVCHELAHAIVIWDWYKAGKKDKYPRPHGGQWRRCYRVLRKHYLLIEVD